MPKAPDGTIMDESSSDEDVGAAVGGAEKEAEGHGGPNPNPAGGVGARPCKECHPCSPGPIDELITALCEATLGPACPDIMDSIHFLMTIEEGLKSKSNPQFLKDYQVKGLMRTC